MRHQLTTIVLGEVSKAMRGDVFSPQAAEKAPHYFETSVPHQIVLGREKTKINDQEIVFQLKGYPPDIILIQASVDLPDIFQKQTLDWEEQIFDYSYKILKKRGGNKEFSEIYSVFTVSGYDGEPEQFLNKAGIMASLLKSESIELDPKEIEHTLATQIKYAKHDLAIIDWDGAFLFDIEGDFEPTIELLALANLQLLRRRILDRQLDERLARMGKLVKTPERTKFIFGSNKSLRNDLREIIKSRMTSISEFQALERDIKLIGDWYSARFYDLTAKKFKIDEWQNSIKTKMDSLDDIYGVVVNNFNISAKDQTEWIQIIAFFILQIGWFVLIILEFLYYTR